MIWWPPHLRRALHDWQQLCEEIERDNGRLRGALREMVECVERHDQWCGHNIDAPGDGIINDAPRRALAALLSPVEPTRQSSRSEM